MSIFSAIFNSDRLPSILVKESRQFVRSRLITWVLCLELLGLMVMTGMALALVGTSGVTQGSMLAAGPGRSHLTGIATVLLAALALAAFDSLLRTAREHDDRHGEMLLVTGLTPLRLLWGKVLSGWALGCLILAAGMPFLVLAYLMRGVSMVFLGVACLALLEYLLVSMVLAQVLAKLSLPGFIRRIGGGGLLALLAFYPYGLGIYEFSMRSSLFSGMLPQLAITLFSAVSLLVLLVMARFFFASPLSRRMRVARLSLLGLLLLFCVLLFWSNSCWDLPEDFLIAGGALPAFVLEVAMLVLALECREFLPFSLRDRRFRLLDAGVSAGVLLGLLCLLACLTGLALAKSSDQEVFQLFWIFGGWLSISTVSGWQLANAISRKFQRSLPPLVMTVVVALFLFFGVGIVSARFSDNILDHLTLFVIPALLAAMLWASFSPPMPDPESLSPESLVVPEPAPTGQPEPTVATLRRNLFTEDWLIRPISKWEKINPVFLKEFRQLWRGRAVSWMLWILAGSIMLSLAVSGMGGFGIFRFLGSGILLLPPVLAIIQLNRSVREIEDQEMLFITALSPREIRHGKVLSALAVCLVVGWSLKVVSQMLAVFFGSLNPYYSGSTIIHLGNPIMNSLALAWSWLSLPLSCVAMVSLAVAIAWSPLPSFHKRYLAPGLFILLSAPVSGWIPMWIIGRFCRLGWDNHRNMMLLGKTAISLPVWNFLWMMAWIIVWVSLWLAAAWTADHWLHRRAAWRNQG